MWISEMNFEGSGVTDNRLVQAPDPTINRYTGQPNEQFIYVNP
jgi:hypothetical protein